MTNFTDDKTSFVPNTNMCLYEYDRLDYVRICMIDYSNKPLNIYCKINRKKHVIRTSCASTESIGCCAWDDVDRVSSGCASSVSSGSGDDNNLAINEKTKVEIINTNYSRIY